MASLDSLVVDGELVSVHLILRVDHCDRDLELVDDLLAHHLQQ